jgi:hypothetical protein
MRPRVIRDDVQNLMDFLLEAEVASFTNPVVIQGQRVTWASGASGVPFVLDFRHITVEQYRIWVQGGHYSCVLADGSLLQITYDLADSVLVGHRLAYVPCPVQLDPRLLADAPLLDVVDIYLEAERSNVLLQSPVRFDFDLPNAGPAHAASHLTINSRHCRIACVAPIHVGRFADFVFKNFYPELRQAHTSYFDAGAQRHLECDMKLTDEHRSSIHLAWPLDRLAS